MGKIDYDSLVSADLKVKFKELFDTINNGSDKAEKVFKAMLKSSIGVSKQIPKTLAQINNFNKAIAEQQKAVIGLEKVEAQRLKTKQQEEILNAKVVKTIAEEERARRESSRALQEEIKVSKELSKAIIEEQRVKQQKKKTSQESIKLKQQELKLTIQEKKEKARLIAIDKKAIESKRKLNSQFEQARIRLEKLAKELKNVAFVEGKNAKSTRKLAKEYDRLRNKVFAAEKVAGQFQRNVGNYPKIIGGATNALRNMGIAIGGLAVIRNIFSTVSGFEQSIANLSAITGAAGADLDFLKNKAIELGSVTTLSAGQVAEGFKLIASAKPELLENADALAAVTESAIVLAEAAGIDLPEAASALANSLNQFGEGAESAAKFVDVLAAGAKFGAGDINFLNEALISSGTVAKDAGLGIQETVAALELFAEKGIPASKAGNSFKNVLLNLQKEGKGFVDGKFNLQAAISQVSKELEDIQDPAKRAAVEIKLFGKENITTGKILLQNNGRLAEMTGLVDANGIAIEQQAINNNTLNGALKAVASAWEGLILKLEQGTGAFAGLKDVLFFIASNLGAIFKSIVVLGAAFITYKATVLLTNNALKLYQITTKGFAIVQLLLSGNIKKATAAMRLFSTVVKLSPVGLLFTAIAALTTAYFLFADTTTIAEKAQKAFNDAAEEGKEKGDALTKTIREQIVEEQRLIDLRLKRGEITEVEADELRNQTLRDQHDLLVKNQLQELDNQDTLEDSFRKEKTRVQKLTETLLKTGGQSGFIRVEKITKDFEEFTITIAKALGISKEAEKVIIQDISNVANKIESANADLVALEIKKQVALLEAEDEAKEERDKGRAKREDELRLHLIRLEDIQDASIVSRFRREEAQLNRKFDRDIAAIIGQSKVEGELRDALEQQRQDKLQDLREGFQAVEDEQRKEDDDRRNEEREKKNNEALIIDEQHFDKILDAERKKLEILAVNQDIANTEFLDLELERLIAQFELLKIYGKDTVDLEQEIADKKHAIFLSNLEEEKKQIEENDKIELELLQKRAQLVQEGAILLNELLREKADERIAILDKELEANRNFQTELQALAARGVVNSEENIAFEKKKQAELELLKQREIELQAKKELVITAVSTYAGYVQNGQTGTSALASTITDIALLKSFINTLDFFLDGTDSTGKTSNALGPNGARVAMLHNDEQVWSKKNVEDGGNRTRKETIGILNQWDSLGLGSAYNMGEKSINKAMEVQRFQSNTDVLAKFDNLEKAVRESVSKTDFHYNSFENAVVKRVASNNRITRDIHKKSPLF